MAVRQTDSHLNHGVIQRAFSSLHRRLIWTILTYRQMIGVVLMTSTGWQDRECRKREMQLADRAGQGQEWMRKTMHCQAGEVMAGAYYVRRMKVVREEAREGLREDGQRRSEDNARAMTSDRRQAYREGTVTGCHRRRPESGGGRDRRVATWELDHSHEEAATELLLLLLLMMDGVGEGGVAKVMVESRRQRCFLRAWVSESGLELKLDGSDY